MFYRRIQNRECVKRNALPPLSELISNKLESMKYFHQKETFTSAPPIIFNITPSKRESFTLGPIAQHSVVLSSQNPLPFNKRVQLLTFQMISQQFKIKIIITTISAPSYSQPIYFCFYSQKNKLVSFFCFV